MHGPEEWLPTTEPGLPASFTPPGPRRGCKSRRCRVAATPLWRNCLIFKQNYLMRYFQYAQYPLVFYDLLHQEKLVACGLNKRT
jgi:hypothetical protein